ncbi:MAG: hypothetical protein Q4D02_01930 [Clostridia bacterium]|nr:hypothetical protein [Clostridia bacterium]
MLKRFCDRCKKEIPELNHEERNLSINECKKHTYKTHIDKYLCEECMNDFINYIEYECNRYKLGSIVTISKEADDKNAL